MALPDPRAKLFFYSYADIGKLTHKARGEVRQHGMPSSTRLYPITGELKDTILFVVRYASDDFRERLYGALMKTKAEEAAATELRDTLRPLKKPTKKKKS